MSEMTLVKQRSGPPNSGGQIAYTKKISVMSAKHDGPIKRHFRIEYQGTTLAYHLLHSIAGGND